MANWTSYGLLVVLCIAQPLAYGQSTGPERILIRNVVLFDPAGRVEDKVVNLLLRENKLDLVTEDKVSRDEADLVVNAQLGVIMGKLELGTSPNFMIFNDDPRDNFQVLMDTLASAVFVVHDGVIVRNRLIDEVAEVEEDEPKKGGWLAYNPPPMVVPTNYQDTSKWNRYESKWVSGVFLSAMVMDRMKWTSQDSGSDAQWGDLGVIDGGEIRGFRAGVVGTLNFEKPWVYTIFAATNAFDKGFEVHDKDSFTFFDYRLDIPFFKNSSLSIGKQKEPISMDRLTGGTFLPNQERSSVADAFLPSRNFGLVWSGNSPERRTSWAFGVFDNFVDDDEDFGDGAQQFVGRLAWAPLVSEDESNLLHVGFGYRYSDAEEGFQYLTEPEFNKAPDFVDTEFHAADQTETYNYELAWRRGPTTLTSEYTRVDVRNPALGNPTFDGYYVTAAWILTGEMRSYNKKGSVFTGIPVARSVYQNGIGAWEVYARYSDIDVVDGLIDGGEMQVSTLGVNWWLTPYFGFNVGYKFITSDRKGLRGKSQGIMSRLVLVLE